MNIPNNFFLGKKTKRFLKRLFLGPEKPRYNIKFKNDGFDLLRDDIILGEICWNKVKKITAYKEDLLTTDRLCMEFDLGDSDSVFAIHEDMKNFQELIDQIERIFQVPKDAWLPKVLNPAFDTKMITIWRS